MEKNRYIIIDNEGNCIFKTNQLTDEIESKIKNGYYEVIDLEAMETINSNKFGLFREKIVEY